ncbi:hypothetical protein D3C73_723300 [compost metagenome]
MFKETLILCSYKSVDQQLRNIFVIYRFAFFQRQLADQLRIPVVNLRSLINRELIDVLIQQLLPVQHDEQVTAQRAKNRQRCSKKQRPQHTLLGKKFLFLGLPFGIRIRI